MPGFTKWKPGPRGRLSAVLYLALLPLILALSLSSCGGGGGTSGGPTCPNICPYSVGGIVRGLATGNSVVLLLNGGDPTTVSANTTFTFATALSPFTLYAVTVGTQPAGQTCTVADGSGEGDGIGPVPNVNVTCAAKLLYASADAGPNTFAAAIYGFTVNSSGTLSPVPGLPAPTADGGGPIAITRDSKVLYTTNNGELLAFQINADGSLSNAPVPSYSMSDAQVGLVALPTSDFLYASGNSGVLTVFAIDSATGALSPMSSVTLGKFLKNSAVVTPNGRYLYQNDLDRNDALFPTSAQLVGFATDVTNGALSPVPGSPLTLTTPSPSTTSSTGPMAIDPTGKFLYVGYQFAVLNVGPNGGLLAYSIDAASGALTAVPVSPFGLGGVPSSLAIDSSGRFLIVSLFPLGGASRLAVFSIDPGTGALASVPGSFGSTYTWGAVAADPSGPYVYAGTALQGDTNPANVFVLSIDQSAGALASMGETTIPDNKLGVSFIALTEVQGIAIKATTAR